MLWCITSVLAWCGSDWADKVRNTYCQVHGSRLMHPPGKPPSEGLVIHEKMHVLQRRQNWLFRIRYLLSRQARLHWECEAYGLQVALGYISFEVARYRLTARAYWPIFGAPSNADDVLSAAVERLRLMTRSKGRV